ncbi:UPF0699 transmembrane protein YdbT [Lentibacillus sp. JNUCC-1]|uniref:PH domain-containing protein n=1 Tax=Lentibacillus sp. JNUCC-1 TaxID=2654513 RepID=UPI0012E7976D|nr:PH domain-containing protein [Lentibacillus sp. JNUCC-1]MUV36752.1 UPF0699 transmembrane protein YdbT [Lentibacillus sp. JNUCC-1]
MITPTRMHPMKIVSSMIKILRDNIIFIFIFFIVNFGLDVPTYINVFRILFLLYITVNVIHSILSWWKTTYEIREDTIHIRSGVFQKKHNTIPLAEIQNITWETPAYFRPFKVTSIRLETSAASDSASVNLDAITNEQAEAIEELATDYKAAQPETTETETHEASDDFEQKQASSPEKQARTVHFVPTTRDLIKASFLSFSFLALIPLIAVGYQNLERIVDIDDKAIGVYSFLTSSWLITAITLVVLAAVFIAFGVVSTFLKYGKYEIASDDERIFIHRGILSVKAFSIRKANVQAIQVSQTPPKKLLRLAEVKLISAGSMEGESEDISTLYPFLPVKRASSLVAELLPHLPVQEATQKLPRQALWPRMLRVPWFGLIAAGALLWFKIEWWSVLIPFFFFIYLSRYFNYRNTRYVWDETGIHFKNGGIWTQHFVTNRKKIIEIEISQSLLQRRLGLATITTVNRVKPVHHEQLEDLPLTAAQDFKQWYSKRFMEKEIYVE